MRWEPSEDKFLLDHYKNLGSSRCAYLLGRSESSICTRAHRLGVEGSKDKNSSCLRRDKPTTLYFISFLSGRKKFYKLGVTNGSVESRFKDEFNRLKMSIEWQREYDTGREACHIEKMLLKKYDNFKINTGALRYGNTETLSVYIDEKELK